MQINGVPSPSRKIMSAVSNSKGVAKRSSKSNVPKSIITDHH